MDSRTVYNLSIVILLVAFVALFYLTPVAYANHSQENDFPVSATYELEEDEMVDVPSLSTVNNVKYAYIHANPDQALFDYIIAPFYLICAFALICGCVGAQYVLDQAK